MFCPAEGLARIALCGSDRALRAGDDGDTRPRRVVVEDDFMPERGFSAASRGRHGSRVWRDLIRVVSHLLGGSPRDLQRADGRARRGLTTYRTPGAALETSYPRKGGIYLTQVAWHRAADRQGLPWLVRGAAGVVP